MIDDKNKFISDDWLFVDPDGKGHGLLQPIKLSDWQLDQLPDYQLKVSRTKRWTMRGIRWLDAFMQAVPESLHNDFFLQMHATKD